MPSPQASSTKRMSASRCHTRRPFQSLQAYTTRIVQRGRPFGTAHRLYHGAEGAPPRPFRGLGSVLRSDPRGQKESVVKLGLPCPESGGVVLPRDRGGLGERALETASKLGGVVHGSVLKAPHLGENRVSIFVSHHTPVPPYPPYPHTSHTNTYKHNLPHSPIESPPVPSHSHGYFLLLHPM